MPVGVYGMMAGMDDADGWIAAAVAVVLFVGIVLRPLFPGKRK